MIVKRRKKRLNRSLGGNIVGFTLLALLAVFMALPIIFTVVNSLKPLNELFIFPPRFYVVRPTLDNFANMFSLVRTTFVPFERYLFNTVFTTAAGTTAYILIAAMAAYPLAKHRFKGRLLFVNLVVWAMMFRPEFVWMPQYYVVAAFGWINTYWSLIIPAMSSSMGVFLMRQFICSSVPDSILEAAKIDGAGEIYTFFRIIMPMVKPAWLTLTIFTFQSLWNATGNVFTYNEEMKMLSNVMSQMSTGGLAYTGVTSAVALFLLIPPVVIFLFCQNSVIETMAQSGIK